MVLDLSRFGILTRRLSQGSPKPTPPPGPGDVVLGHTESGQAVLWPMPQRNSIGAFERATHCLCLAATGAGKTVSLGEAIARELITTGNTEHPTTALIIDPKADLIQVILNAIITYDISRLQDVRYIAPFAGSFPFNLALAQQNIPPDIFALQLAEVVNTVSTGQTGSQRNLGLGARQLDALTSAIGGALTTNKPNATILWALDAFLVKNGFQLLASISNSEQARVGLLSTVLSEDLKVSCASRLRTSFSLVDTVTRSLGADSCLDISELLEPGRIVLVDLSQPPIPSLRRMWCNLWVTMVVNHAMSRVSPWTRNHLRMVIDELDLISESQAPIIAEILARGRSLGVSLVGASQGSALLRDSSEVLWKVLLQNVRTKLVGRLSAIDAEIFSRELGAKYGVDLPVSAIRTNFASSVTNLNERIFYMLEPSSSRKYRTQDVDLSARARAADEHAAELDAVRNRLSLDPNQPPRARLWDVAEPIKPKSKRGRKKAATGPRRRAKGRATGNEGNRTSRPRPPKDQASRPNVGNGEYQGPKPKSRWSKS